MLTIAYLTNRKDPRIKWFFDSLHRECKGIYDGIKLVVVDFWADEPGRACMFKSLSYCPLVHTTPKPTVWQGKHKLTKTNYFAASNARNTAVCFAPDGYIAFVDDLSVLMPGWLESVCHAQENGLVACGSYEKVRELVVDNGRVISAQRFKEGKDSREDNRLPLDPRPVHGGSMFGCSLAMPVKAMLDVNGFDEDCDSMGSEDYIFGLMLQHARYKLFYYPRMLTWESEEDHHVESPFKRIIKTIPGQKDATHVILRQVLHGGRLKALNYFGNDGLVGLRAKILAGESFPPCNIPEHDWRDSQPLREMD
jgi:hypothetical protein